VKRQKRKKGHECEAQSGALVTAERGGNAKPLEEEFAACALRGLKVAEREVRWVSVLLAKKSNGPKRWSARTQSPDGWGSWGGGGGLRANIIFAAVLWV